MIIIDPREIPADQFPFIVSCGQSDWIAKLIEWRTKSWCDHSMLAINPGKFVWESMTSWYGEGPMDTYMVPGTTLKFYQVKGITPAAVMALRSYVANRIAAPWYDKTYDWIGIVGEAIGLPKIHTPGLEYCSVDAIHALKVMGPFLSAQANQIIQGIPDEENPGYLDNIMANMASPFTLYGIYEK